MIEIIEIQRRCVFGHYFRSLIHMDKKILERFGVRDYMTESMVRDNYMISSCLFELRQKYELDIKTSIFAQIRTLVCVPCIDAYNTDLENCINQRRLRRFREAIE